VADSASILIGSINPVCFKLHCIIDSPTGGSLPFSSHSAQCLSISSAATDAVAGAASVDIGSINTVTFKQHVITD
jgi:hypothetical protein